MHGLVHSGSPEPRVLWCHPQTLHQRMDCCGPETANQGARKLNRTFGSAATGPPARREAAVAIMNLPRHAQSPIAGLASNPAAQADDGEWQQTNRPPVRAASLLDR